MAQCVYQRSAMSSAAMEGMALQQLMKELGHEVSLTIRTDNQAARSALEARGQGKMRHIDIKHFVVQQLMLDKCRGFHNPADILTKLDLLGLFATLGRTHVLSSFREMLPEFRD